MSIYIKNLKPFAYTILIDDDGVEIARTLNAGGRYDLKSTEQLTRDIIMKQRAGRLNIHGLHEPKVEDKPKPKDKYKPKSEVEVKTEPKPKKDKVGVAKPAKREALYKEEDLVTMTVKELRKLAKVNDLSSRGIRKAKLIKSLLSL